ncbi:Chromodomain-helicase-DNA-binding protein 1-like [Merluccius polli]|uniref:Chromodomain-helicase-DNA-binding protein 1-like n=1 Tax=Merluccius polli TaxID=89951 RepID=A0AA47MU64_MERPO|nr:Chromodomain-helicase-DNA-binding protein 1-like [Merluccius polli]
MAARAPPPPQPSTSTSPPPAPPRGAAPASPGGSAQGSDTEGPGGATLPDFMKGVFVFFYNLPATEKKRLARHLITYPHSHGQRSEHR